MSATPLPPLPPLSPEYAASRRPLPVEVLLAGEIDDPAMHAIANGAGVKGYPLALPKRRAARTTRRGAA